MSPKSYLVATTGMLALLASLTSLAQAPKQGDKKPADNGVVASMPTLHISVYGAVAKPGTYPYRPGERIINALTDASGPTPQADLSNIKIAHSGKAYCMMLPVWVNLNDFLLRDKKSSNQLLQSGDDLYVLRRKGRYIPQPPEF